MGSPVSKCSGCFGNLWPDSKVKDHVHLTLEERISTLKLKFRIGYSGRKGGAKPRTNPPQKDIAQGFGNRRRSYGPWYDVPKGKISNSGG